jgi:membrane-associated phospholipid phosphatase
MSKVSNQYAAMPSLHFAWSTWSALVLVPAVSHRWLKALIVLYPVATLYAIVVTGNHYFLDAMGGALILTIGAAAGRWWSERR